MRQVDGSESYWYPWSALQWVADETGVAADDKLPAVSCVCVGAELRKLKLRLVVCFSSD